MSDATPAQQAIARKVGIRLAELRDIKDRGDHQALSIAVGEVLDLIDELKTEFNHPPLQRAERNELRRNLMKV